MTGLVEDIDAVLAPLRALGDRLSVAEKHLIDKTCDDVLGICRDEESEAAVLVEAVQNHAPDCIIVDEIGTAKVRDQAGSSTTDRRGNTHTRCTAASNPAISCHSFLQCSLCWCALCLDFHRR